MLHKKVLWATLLIAALCLVSVAGPRSLAQIPSPDGARDPVVVRLYYDNLEQVQAIANQYEIWEEQPAAGYVVFMLSRDALDALKAQGYRLEIDAKKTEKLHEPNSIPGYPCYRTVEETNAALYTMQATYPTLAQVVDIGDSWDKATVGGPAGYDMLALVITNQEIPGPKPRFFLMAEIHARELVTTETAARFAEYLLSSYGTDPEITFFIDYHEIHIVPLTNPDGRKFAEQGDWWRKNTDSDDGCNDPNNWGVDLNRNHTFKWACCGGSSPYPCDEVYRGVSAASEPEIQAIQDYVLSLFPDQRGPGDNDPAPADATGILISLHSYGGANMWPWGWTGATAPNSAQLQALGVKFSTYNHYDPHQDYQLYVTDGTSDDWSYGTLGIASFIWEMGTEFFEGCSYFESTIWPDNRAALYYAVKVPQTPYMTVYGPDSLNAAVAPASVPQGTPVQLTATVNDANNGSQVVQGAEYYVLPLHGGTLPGDPGSGGAMQPADGSWSSTIENVVATVPTAGFGPGEYIIAVRGKDAGQHWGPFTAVFLSITTGLDPEQIEIAASPLAIPIVYGESTVTATLSLLDGTPVGGWPVTFTTSLGDVSPVTAISDINGHAVTTLHAGESTGVAHVTGDAGLFSAGVDVEFVVPEAPTAAFDSNSPVCDGSPVLFQNLTTGPAGVPNTYEWAFGDGTTGTDAEPQHVYPGQGAYTVVLTATNIGGSDVTSGTVIVDAVPEASFAYAPQWPRPGEAVYFSDGSTNNPTAWLWQFGDGAFSTQQNPHHAYAAAGTYPVSLRATNGCGSSAVYQHDVVVGEPPLFHVYLPLVTRNR